MNLHPLHFLIGNFFTWAWSNSLTTIVLIALVVALQFVSRRFLSARWLYGLWLCVLLRLIMPILPQSSFSIFNLSNRVFRLASSQSEPAPLILERQREPSTGSPSMSHQPAQAPAIASAQPLVRSDDVSRTPKPARFADAAPYVWLLGALAYLTIVLAQHRKLSLWIKSQPPLTDHRVVLIIEEVACSLHLKQIPKLYETNCLPAPSLFGFWRPRLLLPKFLLESLSDTELNLIVLHELIHVKRRDVLLNWLMIAVQSLHWFNPFVWLAMSRTRAARELACDAAVMSHLAADDRQVYGATLIKLVAAFSTPTLAPTLIPVINRKKQMHRRITMIANFKPTPRLVTIVSAVVLAAIACFTFTRAAETRTSAPPAGAGGAPATRDVSKDTAAPDRGIQALEKTLAEQEMKVRYQQKTLDELTLKFGISPADESDNGANSVAAEGLRKLETLRLDAKAEYAQTVTLFDALARLSRPELRKTVSTAFPDTLLSSLFAQQATAEQQLAELSIKLGAENPELLIKKAVLEKINQQINDRLDGILSGLKTKSQSLKARMDQMEKELDQAKRSNIQTAIARRPYYQAKRDLEVMQTVFERLQMRLIQEKIDAPLPKQQ